MAKTVLRVKAGLMAKMGLLAVMVRTALTAMMETQASLS
jgi:threonine aldolase